MGMFEMSEDQVAEWRQQCRDLAAPKVNGEEVLAAAGFRQDGASANYVASKGSAGGLVYAGVKMLRKKQAGGLPDKVMLALTPNRLYAFELQIGRNFELGDEVAVWERPGLKTSTEARGGMMTLTIESPAEGRRQRRPDMAIHRPRGGHCWYYWLVIVGGTAFVIAYLLTDGFGLEP
jgi:hypothetical protein